MVDIRIPIGLMFSILGIINFNIRIGYNVRYRNVSDAHWVSM